MFNTDARVKLSDFADLLSLVRDTEFFCCGKIPTRATKKLVPLGSEKYLSELLEHEAEVSGVVCTPELADRIPESVGCAVSAKPVETVFKIHQRLTSIKNHFWDVFPSRIHSSADIHPTAYIAEHDVVIGEGAKIGPNAVIMERVIIGRNCYIGPNTTIGTDAYEIATVDGAACLMPQAGGILIGDNVIFLSNSTVARSSFPSFTQIGDGCSFDNLVHVAHDCVLGKNIKMTACSILSGRVTLGDDVYIGPNATISNGVSIASRARVTIGAVVVKDVDAGKVVTGNFAIEHSEFKRNMARTKRS